MYLLFQRLKTIATVVSYTCKSFIELTPGFNVGVDRCERRSNIESDAVTNETAAASVQTQPFPHIRSRPLSFNIFVTFLTRYDYCYLFKEKNTFTWSFRDFREGGWLPLFLLFFFLLLLWGRGPVFLLGLIQLNKSGFDRIFNFSLFNFLYLLFLFLLCFSFFLLILFGLLRFAFSLWCLLKWWNRK